MPNTPAPEITVTAPRGLTVGGIEPLLELLPPELESYGADSLSDLVDARKLLTRSATRPWCSLTGTLTSRDNHVGSAAGDLSATVNVSLDNVSDFGTLLSQSYGLDWTPVNNVHLNAIFSYYETPRTVQQVLAPETVTPNVEMFDFVTGQTFYVTSISGGAPNLHATDDRVTSLGVSLGPLLGKTSFSAHYEQHRTRDAVGTLIEIDNRSVNLQRQNLNVLKWGFNAWFPFGPATKVAISRRRPMTLAANVKLRTQTKRQSARLNEFDIIHGWAGQLCQAQDGSGRDLVAKDSAKDIGFYRAALGCVTEMGKNIG